MIFAALCLLAVLDAALAGFRSAAGRNLRIAKQRYYARALLHGAIAGALAMAMEGVVAAVLVSSSTNPDALWQAFAQGGRIMLVWYAPYAGLVLSALLAYTTIAYEVRSVAVVMVLGPFTLIRPVLVIGGALHASLVAPSAAPAAVSGAILVLLAGWVLDKRQPSVTRV